MLTALNPPVEVHSSGTCSCKGTESCSVGASPLADPSTQYSSIPIITTKGLPEDLTRKCSARAWALPRRAFRMLQTTLRPPSCHMPGSGHRQSAEIEHVSRTRCRVVENRTRNL